METKTITNAQLIKRLDKLELAAEITTLVGSLVLIGLSFKTRTPGNAIIGTLGATTALGWLCKRIPEETENKEQKGVSNEEIR